MLLYNSLMNGGKLSIKATENRKITWIYSWEPKYPS